MLEFCEVKNYARGDLFLVQRCSIWPGHSSACKKIVKSRFYQNDITAIQGHRGMRAYVLSLCDCNGLGSFLVLCVCIFMGKQRVYTCFCIL